MRVLPISAFLTDASKNALKSSSGSCAPLDSRLPSLLLSALPVCNVASESERPGAPRHFQLLAPAEAPTDSESLLTLSSGLAHHLLERARSGKQSSTAPGVVALVILFTSTCEESLARR